MPTAPKKKPRRHLMRTRDHLLTDALRMMVVMRRGRWTVYDAAEEIGINWRTVYRMIHAFRLAGITVELSRERDQRMGMGSGYYTIPAEPLRKLLRL